ncbi:MAG: hypothetical protein M1839_003962 [Geoglossum umbratile]|nr:MAG: hypothetical protein M1839_003962 [Geoglossum umbratile]
MEEEIWVHSRQLDPEEVRKTGCFTNLPVRVNKRDDIADSATQRLAVEWAEIMEGDRSKVGLGKTCSDYGNYCSYLYPESKPERLGLMTYLTEMAFIHDDVAEDMDFDGAMEEHNAFAQALDVVEDRGPAKTERASKMKKLLAQATLECVKLDHEVGMEIVDAYRKKWLVDMDIPNTETFQTLDDYLAFRRANAGAPAFWVMIGYSHGHKFTDEDYEIMKPVMNAGEKSMLLMNDYYSWQKEYEASSKFKRPGRIVNAIEFLMREESLSMEAAKQKVKNLILEYEDLCILEKTKLYKNNPSLPFHLRKLLEVCGCVVAGAHFWSANAPRYNSRKTKIEEEGTLGVTPLKRDGRSFKEDTKQCPTKRRKIQGPGTKIRPSADSGSQNGNVVVNGTTTEGKKIGVLNLDTVALDLTALLSPCTYIQSLPSKGVRSSLVEALNIWLLVPEKPLAVIKEIISVLHNSSLILDDIEDDSPLRRGKTSTHIIFGPAQSTNSANFLYVSAARSILSLEHPETLVILLEELQSIFTGQSWDLYWKYNLICPTEAEYFSMVDQKTGALFRMLLRLMQSLSPLVSTHNIEPLVRLMGRYFQIRDDYMNLQSSVYSQQKGFCEDLDEGKFSYPIVHCLSVSPPSTKNIILGLFRRHKSPTQQPLPVESKLQILACMKQSGTLEATLGMLKELEGEAERVIGVLEEETGEQNPMMRLLLEGLRVQPPKQGGSGKVE